LKIPSNGTIGGLVGPTCGRPRLCAILPTCAPAIPTTIRRPNDNLNRIEGRRSPSGHIRAHGVRHLLIYCSAGLYCHHSAVVDADRWPDDTVLLDLDRKAVCTKCGMIGADVRPNWSERPPAESMPGAQWR